MTFTSWEELTLPASPSAEDSLRLLARMLVSASRRTAIPEACTSVHEAHEGVDVSPGAKVMSES